MNIKTYKTLVIPFVAVLLLCGCGGWFSNEGGAFRHTLSPSADTERWELFWTSVKEAQPYRLTAPSMDGRSLAWSPDGTKLTFISNRDGNDEVYVMNSDGSTAFRLTYTTAAEDDPEWAPDGSRIVFTSERTGRWEVYSTTADGSQQQQLTRTAKGDSINPAWSPIISGGPCAPPSADAPMPPDPAQSLAKPEVCFGQALSYVSNKDGNWEVYTIWADGTHDRRLTHDPAMDGFCWNEWSPDGRSILFDSNRDGTYQVYRMDLDGNHQRNLTSVRAPVEGPAWSPDGRQVIYTSRQDGNWEIYRANSDGTDPRRLTVNRAKDFNPFWSPDGKTIAFISDRDGHNEIYIMNGEGSNPRRLTWGMADKGRDRHRWSPDGSKIAYVAYTGRDEGNKLSVNAARQRERFSASDD